MASSGAPAGKTPRAGPTPSACRAAAWPQIAAGAYHDLAVTNGGVLYAWGRNQRYQLGNSRNENADSPVRVLTGTGSGGAYPVFWTDGISDWARPYAEELYPTAGAPHAVGRLSGRHYPGRTGPPAGQRL